MRRVWLSLLLLLVAVPVSAEPIQFSVAAHLFGFDLGATQPLVGNNDVLDFTMTISPSASWPAPDDVLSLTRRVTFGGTPQRYSVLLAPDEGPFTLTPGVPVTLDFATLAPFLGGAFPDHNGQYTQVFLETFVNFASGDTIYGAVAATWLLPQRPTVDTQPTPIPEPASFALVGSGLAWLTSRRRRSGASRHG